MEKNLSPEEKLLRLIRNKNKETSAPTDNSSVAYESGPPVFKQAHKNILQFLFKPRLKILFSLKKLNIIIVSVAIILFGYVVFELLFSADKGVKKLKAQEKADLKSEAKEAPVKEMPSFDYYASQINKRDIFKPVFLQGEPTQSSIATEQAANLRLAGIIVDKQQPQAIIEDTKLKKTYFLYKGDSLGDMRVEDIQESKVILDYGGEKIELVP